jgi:hypothetical protein
MGKRKAAVDVNDVDDVKPEKKTKKASTTTEKKSKRKVEEEEEEVVVVVTKKTRSGKAVVDDDVVPEVKPVKAKNAKKEKIIVIEPSPVKEKEPTPVKQKKEPVKRVSKSKSAVVEAPKVLPVIKQADESKAKAPKKVVFEASIIAGKTYNEEGEVFQQVEQMWNVFDTVVLISLIVNAMILIGSKYVPDYTEYLGVHVQYNTVEDGFMSYIKLVMWSFPTIVSLYTTVVLPFVLIEKGVSKVLGLKNPAIVRVHLLLLIIAGSIFYYFDPKLAFFDLKNLRGLTKSLSVAKVTKSAVKSLDSFVNTFRKLLGI